MKLQHLTALLLTAMLPAGAASNGTILLSNHDQLGGGLSSISKERIIWESPLLERPASFMMGKVQELNLPAATPESTANYEAVVALTNGDTLRGQLASVTDKTIELDTWYAGRLTLNRPMVETVHIEDRPKLLFRGPDSIDGWTIDENSQRQKDKPAPWFFESGALQSRSQGGISRDVKLPDLCRIGFTLEWHSALRLKFVFASDAPGTVNPRHCYELMMQRRYASLRKKSESGSIVLGPQTQNIPEFSENEKARVELCVDRKKGVFNLIVEGRSVVVWNDPDARDVPTGGNIHFVTEDGSSIRISRIEISAWDGVIDQMPETEDLNAAEQQENEAKEAKSKEVESGRMMLRNGDSLAGDVLSIKDGLMKVKTRFSEIDLPVSRLKTISLKPVDPESPKIRDGDIRAWFPDGSRVVFRLDSSTADTLTGYSQNFGTATFKTSAFNRIEFNLYDPAFMELRGEKGW
ncbi:hypothetical protein [Luteolibacter sp. LG18]|uniref:hypothetical protein n=1 Tax=Luteolibacter sp. LG18 TaxID=2819286 RepID=UPI002B313CE4|nr:hypothetical protein llg_02450 [Luteolibacter sp. LG18]